VFRAHLESKKGLNFNEDSLGDTLEGRSVGEKETTKKEKTHSGVITGGFKSGSQRGRRKRDTCRKYRLTTYTHETKKNMGRNSGMGVSC